MILKEIRFLITQNPNRDVLENVDIRIENGKILEIAEDIDGDGVDCSGKLVMPGLVNTHTHASMNLFRGISDNKNLQDWLFEDIFPAEEEMDADDAYAGALLACIEMLKTGTTCFNDMYENMDRVAEAVEETGIRALLSRGIVDVDGDWEPRVKEAREFVHDYHEHDLITPGVAPHAVYTCSEELLRAMKWFAEDSEAVYHIHVSETEKENQDLLDEKGMTPTEYLDSIDLLDSSVIAAHGTNLTEKDRWLLSKRGANIAHNPAANLKLGSGIAEVPKLIDLGVNVSLGTDGVASNNSLNLFEEMKLAGLLHKREDPTALTEQDVLDMATIKGAKALDMEDEIGSIEEGKKADLVMIDKDHTALNPYFGPQGLVSNLVFSFNGDVSDVIVNGEFVIRDGRVVNVDEEAAAREVQKRVEKFS